MFARGRVHSVPLRYAIDGQGHLIKDNRGLEHLVYSGVLALDIVFCGLCIIDLNGACVILCGTPHVIGHIVSLRLTSVYLSI